MPTIGILGGGQLAAYLASEALRDSINVVVLDEDPTCPASLTGARIIQGSPKDEDDIRRLAAVSDILTIDREAVNVDALLSLELDGKTVLPSARTLQKMTDKLKQKQHLVDSGIPTAEFTHFDSGEEELDSPFGWPVVQKVATGGYDGRGVAVLSGPEDSGLLDGEGYLEAWVDCEMELSVIVVRGGDECVSYPPVEMTFNSDNTLEYLVSPARIPPDLARRATQLAERVVEAFGSDGVFGVEMFLAPGGRLLINEVAPRTHNSGHHTLDTAIISQFGQQLRLLKGLKPLPVDAMPPAVMFNLLGISEPVDSVDGSVESSVRTHWYGKTRCFPGRKMGHVTVLGSSVDEALTRAMQVHGEIYRENSQRSAA